MSSSFPPSRYTCTGVSCPNFASDCLISTWASGGHSRSSQRASPTSVGSTSIAVASALMHVTVPQLTA